MAALILTMALPHYSMPSCYIHITDADFDAHAQALSQQLDIPISNTDHSPTDYCLVLDERGLHLHNLQDKTMGALHLDFTAGKAAHRRQFGGGRGQPLAKAVGLKQGASPHIVDLSAGMGRDGFVLASLGCAVTLVERTPMIHALLADAITRAQDYAETQSIAHRLHVVSQCAKAYLVEQPKGALAHHVLYFDPMYPHREKSALVKKEMRMFRDWVGNDDDADDTLLAALDAQPARVVVKRPKGAPHLANQTPHTTIDSKNTRYDVYSFRKVI